MIVVVVMMTAPVVMPLDTVEKDRPPAIVDMTIGLMVAKVLRFELVT